MPNKLRVQGMARLVGLHARQKRQPDQRQVADQINRLVRRNLTTIADWTLQNLR